MVCHQRVTPFSYNTADFRMALPTPGNQFWKYFSVLLVAPLMKQILPKYIRICVYDAKIPFVHLLEGNKVKKE